MQEEEKWSQGSKSTKSKEDKEARRLAELARKAENARMLEEEEKSAPKVAKAAPKAGGKKKKEDVKPAGPGALAAGGLKGLSIPPMSFMDIADRWNITTDAPKSPTSPTDKSANDDVEKVTESFSATGLDDAIDLMELVNAKSDKAAVGTAASGLERHPERRFKVPMMRPGPPGPLGERWPLRLELTQPGINNTTIASSTDIVYYEVITPKWSPNMTRVSKRDNESRKLELVAELETSGYQSLFRVAEKMSGVVGSDMDGKGMGKEGKGKGKGDGSGCGKFMSASEWMKRSAKSDDEV